MLPKLLNSFNRINEMWNLSIWWVWCVNFQLDDVCGNCRVNNLVVSPNGQRATFSWSVPLIQSVETLAHILHNKAATLLPHVRVDPRSIKLDYRKCLIWRSTRLFKVPYNIDLLSVFLQCLFFSCTTFFDFFAITKKEVIYTSHLKAKWSGSISGS